MENNKKSSSKTKKMIQLVALLVLIFVVLSLVIKHPAQSLSVLFALFGFGSIIFIHELGHFLVARFGGIECEAFSIGFGPFLLGIKKTDEGLRIRVMPSTSGEKEDPEGDCLKMFTLPFCGGKGETEYMIGITPLGGFVKMLGQDDTGPSKSSDNPKSFANKPVGIRMAVVAAGVVFNIIGAFVILTGVASSGIEMAPAVIGQVSPGSPAEESGLLPGDEIVEIDGKSFNLNFSHVSLAAALADEDDVVPMKIKRADEEFDIMITPKELDPVRKMKGFGVTSAYTLKIADLNKEDAAEFERLTNLRPGDVVELVNGEPVANSVELNNIVSEILDSSVQMTLKRESDADGVKSVEVNKDVPLDWTLLSDVSSDTENSLSNVCSMLPRLKITSVANIDTINDSKIKTMLRKIGVVGSEEMDPLAVPSHGDIIVKAGEVEYPNFIELREQANVYSNRAMPLSVLRTNADGDIEKLELEVTPKVLPGQKRATIGIGVTLDATHPIVADTIGSEMKPALVDIPRGATIVSVDGEEVGSFYEVASILKDNVGQRVSIEYFVDSLADARSAAIQVPSNPNEAVTVKAQIGTMIPFKELKRLYKAESFFGAIRMSGNLIYSFMATNYSTISSLIKGGVSPSELTGPIGIAKMSYTIIDSKKYVNYFYFLGLISSCLAVMNFLPIPLVDGGLFILLIVEKIKGSPISERGQQIFAYVGLALIMSLFVFIIYSDLVKLIFNLI